MRLMLADDHILFMDSLQYLLETNGVDVIGQARNGREAIYKAKILQPDIILMDIRMPECSGIEALKKIKTETPCIKVIMLTTSEDEEDIFDAIRYGASGYLIKSADGKQLIHALEQVACGEVDISSGLATRILQEFRKRGIERGGMINPKSSKYKGNLSEQRNGGEEYSDFTERQWEILKQVASGVTYKEVGSMVGLTERTVKYHMGNIIEQLQLDNRAQVIAYVSKHKFFEDEM